MLGALVVKGQSGEGGREALEQLEVLGDAGAVASTERGVGLDEGGQMYVAEVAAVQALYESRDVLLRRRVLALVSSTYIYNVYNVSRRSKSGCGGGSKGGPASPDYFLK